MTLARYQDLDGASIFVTGGASGIGAALVAGFARQGAHVTFADLADGTALVEALAEEGAPAPRAVTCDVTDSAALKAAIEEAAALQGPFRAIVNNAANDQRMDATDITPEDWDQMQAVNLRHYFFACQAAQPHMVKDGSIINYTSTSYLIGGAGMAPYVAANAGITGLTRSLAREWGPKGLRVNGIAPGWVLTEKQLEKWATPEALADFLDRQCLKRHLEPDDLVGTTLFLASGASAMLTGQVIVVDAGVVHTG